MLPWWNEEAEQRFWWVMTSRWLLQIFDTHGIRKWDVLKIKSYYNGKDDRYILF
jgi:hypothetical protein